jgi:PPE-repeat protein
VEAVAEPMSVAPEATEPAKPETMSAKPVAGPVAGPADGAPAAERNGVASATDASAADVVPAEPVAPEPVADQATSIQVHGLGSFGAITSFKQSLEKVDGIRSVTLGLGPSGEFVYTATHAPAFDLGRAIRAIEGEGVEIERDNGTLRVKVGKAARAG